MLFRRRKMSQASEIREFVYLDETSVESLLASIDGEILVQRTSTNSKSVEFGAASSAGMFDQAKFSSSLKASRGREVQELSKSVAQSAFARFRARNQDRFALRPIDSVNVSKRGRAKLSRMDPRTIRALKQGLPLAALRRGDLLEIETNVSAADIFKARTAMNAVSDVIESYPAFLSIEQRDVFKAVRPLTDLIDKLNGDAIPVIGEAPSLRVADVAGERWLLQTAVAPADSAPNPFTLESVVQPRWFWGDVGRTLFQNHRFRILCRVVNPDLSPDPSSSYVGTILRTIDDGLATTVDNLGSMFLGALRAGHRRSQNAAAARAATVDIVDWYSAEYHLLAGSEASTEPNPPLALLMEVPVVDLAPDDQVQFFAALDTVLPAGATPLSADQRAGLRDRTRTQFGLWPWSAKPAETDKPNTDTPVRQYLEVEVIAVYW